MSEKLPELSSEEMQRYARHLSVPSVGMEGQKRLKAASVLCIGAGGLGSPVALYLAAAGVGRLGLVDPDVVEFSNLQRQVLHGTNDVGRTKLESAKDRLQEINPEIQVDLYPVAFTAENAEEIAAPYSVILDGTDNFPTRYLSNDVAVFQGKPNVYGSVHQFEGQCSVFAPHLGGPCYRCMFPKPPAPGSVPSCAEAGVLGVLPGLVGMLQSTEVLKLLLGEGDPLIGRLLHLDALAMRFREIKLRRDPDCPVCGENPTITEPINYEEFCGVSKVKADEGVGEQNKPSSSSDRAEGVIHALEPRELAAQLHSENPPMLLDVREPFEREICQIKGAVAIPLGELVGRIGEIELDANICVYCKSGARSLVASQKLLDYGFVSIANLTGGIDLWASEVDPEMARY